MCIIRDNAVMQHARARAMTMGGATERRDEMMLWRVGLGLGGGVVLWRNRVRRVGLGLGLGGGQLPIHLIWKERILRYWDRLCANDIPMLLKEAVALYSTPVRTVRQEILA